MKTIVTIISSLFIAFSIQVHAQNADITASPLSGGTSLGPISFEGNPQVQATAFNFNDGNLPTGWTSSPYTVGRPCNAATGNTPDNSNYFWATTTDASGYRFVATNPVNVSSGGNIIFQLRFGNDDPDPGCEEADSGEGVYLQYKTSSGSWTQITYIEPTSYYTWTLLEYSIPEAAKTSSTQFRWIQTTSSGDQYDNWGLDDISIGATISGFTSHSWTVNDVVVSTAGQSLSYTFPSVGNYTVGYSFTSTSVNGSDLITYAINSVPTLDAISNQNAGVSGGAQSVNLTGITDGGIGGQTLSVTATSNNTSVVPHPTITYTSPNATGTLNYSPNAAGSAIITVTVSYTNAQTVSTTRTFTITVSNLPPNPTSITANPSAICLGNSTQLTANGAQGTVYWYTGSCGGTELTTGNSIEISPTVTTTYYARNYDNSQFSAGCASVTITVNPLLQYRSVLSGNWTTLSNWEQFNGTSWVAATSYPGEISNGCSNPLVTIQTGHQMEIQTGSSIDIPNLKIEGTGKLTIKSGGKIYVQDQLELDENAGGAIVVE